MSGKEKTRERAKLQVVRASVAGIDIGSQEHWVACPPKEDGSANVRRFKSTTEGLGQLVDWMEQEHIESVAMESTGVYWIPLYELLESRGIEAMLVNSRLFHNVPGRPKTDFLDCQWLQQLHSYGLLRGSFRPAESLIPVRQLQRQVANLVSLRAKHIQWMQKSLDQMNVQVHRAVTDLSGVTGMAILRAIVAGERDATKLAMLRKEGCAKNVEEMAKHLTGTWREEHLFSLKSTLKLYDVLGDEIAKYEAEILRRLRSLEAPERSAQPAPAHPKPAKMKQLRRTETVELREQLWRYAGVDLTRIDGLSAIGAQVILSEIGTDLTAFPSEGHFVSWLRLCPRTMSSGGKALKARRNGLGANRIATVFRLGAASVGRTKTALGAYFRRVSRVKGHAVAVFATARKLAQLTYRMLRYGEDYVDIGEQAIEERHELRRLDSLRKAARASGFVLVPAEAAG